MYMTTHRGRSECYIDITWVVNVSISQIRRVHPHNRCMQKSICVLTKSIIGPRLLFSFSTSIIARYRTINCPCRRLRAILRRGRRSYSNSRGAIYNSVICLSHLPARSHDSLTVRASIGEGLLSHLPSPQHLSSILFASRSRWQCVATSAGAPRPLHSRRPESSASVPRTCTRCSGSQSPPTARTP